MSGNLIIKIKIMSIKQKLIGLTVLIALAMIALLVVSNFSRNKITNMEEGILLLIQSNTVALTLRRNEKDFLARKSLSYQEKFEKNFLILKNRLKQIVEFSKSNTIDVGLIEKLIIGADKYHKQFSELVAIIKEIGLDEKKGLYGSLRSSVQGAEKLLLDQKDYRIISDMLMLRRREKDFMLRSQLSYVEKFGKDYAKMINHLETSDQISDSLKPVIKPFLENYHRSFIRLVKGYQKKGLDPKSGILGDLRNTVHDFEDSLKKSLKIFESEINNRITRIELFMNVISICFIVVILIITILIINSSSKSIQRLKVAVNSIIKMSGQDIETESNHTDEIGKLVNALEVTLDNLTTMIRDINDNSNSLKASSTELSTIAGQIASGSESNVEKSNSVSAAAEEMNVNMTSVASAMEEATGNIDTVASASEEMNSSIEGIVKQVETAKESTHNAVSSAGEVSQNVNKLGKDAEEISTVTEAIASISDKTNLLALNATIEAARAGEAGKGFAVVANEIKELANQTAEATTNISKKLKGIQNSTGIAVTGIEGITRVIKDINDVVASINDTMGQQSSAIQEISENINQASLGVKEINQNVSQTSDAAAQVASEISIVNESAGEVSISTAQLNQSAEELNKMAIELKNKMEQFKV